MMPQANQYPLYMLAGGQSRRMGQPKALLPFPIDPLLIVLVRRFLGTFRDICVVVSPALVASFLLEKTLSDYGFKNQVIVDAYPAAGPLAGLECAARHARHHQTTRWLVMPCDMPFLTADFLMRLACAAPSARAVVPATATGQRTGVCAAYHPDVHPTLSALLEAGQYRVQSFLEHISAATLPFSTYADLPNAERLLFNLNTPEDYRQALHWESEDSP